MNIPFFKRTLPIKRSTSEQADLFNNSNRISRILYRFNSYTKITNHAVKNGVTLKGLLLSKFPTRFPDAIAPPVLSIELTNYCNLKCPYCTSTLSSRKKGLMPNELVEKISKEAKLLNIQRIQMVGNGESTLHPNFEYCIHLLNNSTPYLSIVTNGQWSRDVTPLALLNNTKLIEISVDAGGKDQYESSRLGGKYDNLIENLELINRLKKENKFSNLINIRLMIRPSQLGKVKMEIAFWKQYCDIVMPQFLTKINGTEYEVDIFIPKNASTNKFPKCSLPFYHLEVKWNGDVLMCYYSPFQIGEPGLLLGNANVNSIVDLWNHAILKQYRNAHRSGNKQLMPICKGCPGT